MESIAKLKPSNFAAEIKNYSRHHHPGTRQWILDDIDKWCKSDLRNSNVCLVTGDPGMGKSVLAAKLCSLERDNGTLAGCFFFQHQKTRRNNPVKLLHTLAHQFIKSIPCYLKIITDQISDDEFMSMNTSDLFTLLILEPVHQITAIRKRMTVIIDAIDECDFEFRNDLLKLIIREFTKLPLWLNVIITTRSDQKVLQKLKRIKQVFELQPNDPRNIADIRIYLSNILRSRMTCEEFNQGVDILVKKSEGMFLYFHYVSEDILCHNTLTLMELQSLLPDGIDDYYEANFRRIFMKLGKKMYFSLLQAIIAARSDFPQSLIGTLLNTDESETVRVVSVISTILPVHEKHIHIFHKSVRDWVTDVDLAEDLLVKPSFGHNDVARVCFAKFQEIKSYRYTPSELYLDPSCRYVIENIVYHFCNAKDDTLQDDLLETLFDLRYMYYRLHLSQKSAVELLDDFEEAQKVNSQLSALIDTYFAFVRRNAEHLATMPHLVYQYALNEPEEISSRLKVQSYADNLQDLFPDLTVFLELINKPSNVAAALVKCTCDSHISAMDIVPHSQKMVCSDINGNIYVWNKRSAEILCKEKVEGYNFMLPITECSVSPDGTYISYGDLSQALTLEGNIIPQMTDAKTNANTCKLGSSGKYVLAWSYYGEGLLKLLKEIGQNFCENFVVELWNMENVKCIRLECNRSKETRPTSACFSHDDSLVICGHMDGKIIIWETNMGAQKAILYTDGNVIKHGSFNTSTQQPKNDPVYSLSFSPNGHYIAAGCGEGILLWDAPALSFILRLPCSTTMIQNSKCLSCAFSPNSQQLAGGFSNGYIFMWNLHVSSEGSYPLILATQPTGSTDSIVKCILDEDSNIICAIGNNICIYSFESLSNVMPQAPSVSPHKKVVSSIFIPNSTVALTCGSSYICAWEGSAGNLRTKSVLPGSGHMIGLSEKLVVIFGDQYNIHVFDRDTLEFRQTISHCSSRDFENEDESPPGIAYCAISNNEMIAYGTGDGYIYVCYGCSFSNVLSVNAHELSVTYIGFFPHSNSFISADDDGNVIKWELIEETENELKVHKVPMIKHNDSVEQILFSPSGIYPQRIITCSADNLLHLYDSQTCDLIKKLDGHQTEVLKIALTFDGKLIGSGDSQGCTIVWDSFTGKLLKRMSYKATGVILDLFFTGKGKYLCVRGSNMNAVIVYNVMEGVPVSVLSFASVITSSSGSWNTCSSSENDLILCGLADGTLKFVKVCEVLHSDSGKAEVVSKSKLQDVSKTKKSNFGKYNGYLLYAVIIEEMICDL